MIKGKENILKRLQELSRQQPVIMPGLVKSVDENNLTCDIEINELLFKCRLNAAESSIKGFVLIPAIKSWILAGRLDDDGNIWVMLSCSEIDKIIMRNGQKGGLININDLVVKLNNIEQHINDLKQIFINWTPVPQDGGAALKTVSASWASQQLNITNVSDIEDDKILH
jgi:hypothetical protein